MSLDGCLDDGITMLSIGNFTVGLVDRLINDMARRWRRRWWRTSIKGGLSVYHEDGKEEYQLEWKGFKEKRSFNENGKLNLKLKFESVTFENLFRLKPY